MHSSGSHWTRNSSTKVDLFLCVIRRGGHLSSTTLMRALSSLTSLLLRASRVIYAFCLRSAFLLSHLRFLGDGKCRMVLGGGIIAPSVGVVLCFSAALRMECWRVTLSKASGEWVSGRRAQSSSMICLHMGAMDRSQRGVKLILPFSLSSVSHPLRIGGRGGK